MGVYSHSENIPICLATCRPYYYVKPTITWRSYVEDLYKLPSTELISINKQFGNFVNRYKRYPNIDELILFMYNRYVVHGDKNTLPRNISEMTIDILNDYKQVIQTVSPETFITRLNNSTSIIKRIEIENSTKTVR